jgi:regulation of enolase protein 1 (concanavalin A-like superfamily)
MQSKKQFLALFLFFATGYRVAGQGTENISIPSIPYPLNWEIKPVKYTIKGNELFISAGEKTDMFRDPNVTYNTDNAPKLMFRPDQDFVLTASIEHSFTNKWDGGAIVLKSDSLNWVKFCFEKDYTGARRIVSVVTKNISDDCNSVEIKSNKVYYKIAKAGNVITLYYSETGSNWFLVRHLQFDAKPGFTVGFLAQSPTGKNCDVTFSNIKYEARKIKDPYVGD